MINLIRFLNIVMVALVAGILVGVWLGYNPKNLSAATYIEQQQGAIRALNSLMPLLGLITIILTLASAFLHKQEKNIFVTLLIAAALLIAGGLVTRLGNQPINAIVMTWNANAPPSNWTEFRDKWWSLHIVRTLTTFLALCLIVFASMRRM